MEFIKQYQLQIVGLLAVAIFLSLGRKPLLTKAKGDKFLLWLAWAITAVCGLILGWALVGVVQWLTSRPGTVGGVVASLGGALALAFGWYAVRMVVDLIRDLMDGRPDDEARRAALWIPTLLPAGWTAVWTVVSNPRGLGTALTAVVMAVITIVGANATMNAALKAQRGKTFWLWFASAVCLLAGLVTIPLVLYVDGWVARTAPEWLLAFRIIGGSAGIAWLIGAMVDLRDKKPDMLARSFLRFGLPLLFAFGAVAFSFVTGGASDGAQILNGTL